MKTAAIIGSAGYTGQETLDRVLGHPGLSLLAAGSNTFAGQPGSVLDPRLDDSFTFVTNDEAAASGADVIFLCTGNEAAAAFQPPAGAVVIDLSGVHRLLDQTLAQRYYKLTPGAWSYGLPEISPATGPLIANPGCHATTAALALAPARGLTSKAVVDSKTGMTGAGRELKPTSHAGFVLENLSAYAVGSHRHAPEIEQTIGFPVAFVPHLLPVRRGVITTCYFEADADLRPLYESFYAGSKVVRLLPEGGIPELSRVQNTDAAEIGLFTDDATGMKIVICATDNLGKGAAGQAVQNANLALGLDETAGLRLKGVSV
jgi:N-acetyl-gamma-glutamyl-phosphate reductase